MTEIRKGARKWHSKSRTGCQACKGRKVKCDEYRPSCRNCLKRGVRCDFLNGEQEAANGPGTAPLSIEMELLHNFTVSTAATLASDPQVRDMWRVKVPQIGFSTRYVLDGIMSLSALHMARSDPARRELLLAQATQHLNSSLKEALPLIANVGRQHCDDTFIFAVLTLFINLASPRRQEDMLLVDTNTIPQWLFLLRGIIPLFEANEEAILSSSVSLLFRTSDFNCVRWAAQSPAEDVNLDQLEAGVRARTVASKERQACLLLAIQGLRRSFAYHQSDSVGDEARLRGFYTWLFEVSDDYLALLKLMDMDALCVFAFFAVLVRELEKYWWAEGWASHLIQRIYLHLNDEYRLYIRWPIEEVGWAPPARG